MMPTVVNARYVGATYDDIMLSVISLFQATIKPLPMAAVAELTEG